MLFLRALTIVVVLIISSAGIGTTGQDDPLSQFEKELIGIWQDGFPMADGWVDNYQLFPDRRYKFNYNQMDCSKNKLWEQGTWKVQEGALILTKNSVTVLEGGYFVIKKFGRSSRVCLVGASQRTLELDPPATYRMAISVQTKIENETKTILIGQRKFWLMRADPNDYQ